MPVNNNDFHCIEFEVLSNVIRFTSDLKILLESLSIYLLNKYEINY